MDRAHKQQFLGTPAWHEATTQSIDEVYQTRAAVAGMSLQEYLLAELVRNAGLRSPAELIDEVEARMRVEGREGFAAVSSADLMRADRDSR